MHFAAAAWLNVDEFVLPAAPEPELPYRLCAAGWNQAHASELKQHLPVEEKRYMSFMDRRTLLTALVGACAAAGAMGALATSATAAVPRATSLKTEADADAAEAGAEGVEGEAQLHNAQYFVVRRRPRRRWFWRPFRRRRRYY